MLILRMLLWRYFQFSSIVILLIFTIFPAHALKTQHILRRVDTLSREEVEKRNKLLRLRKVQVEELREKVENGLIPPEFHIHHPIVCRDAALGEPTKEILRLRDKTRITQGQALENKKIMSLMFEVASAHLEISDAFHRNGKFIKNQTVRFHSLIELAYYPEEVARNDIYDLVRSSTYILYVIYPVMRAFFLEHPDGQILEDRFITLIDLLSSTAYDDKVVHYEKYRKIAKEAQNILDKVHFFHLGTSNPSETHAAHMTYVTMVLLHHAWQAYVNALSCPKQTKIIDPILDPYEEDMPEGHDAYVVGYGLLQRAKFLMQRYIYDEDTISDTHFIQKTDTQNIKQNRIDRLKIKKMVSYFDMIYDDIVIDDKDDVTFSTVYRSVQDVKELLKRRYELSLKN